MDLFLNSHTIVYERSHSLGAGKVDMGSGVTYVVVGGAGAQPDWFDHKRAWHTAQGLAVPHFAQVVIAGNSLELRAIDQEGHPFDWLRLGKQRGRWAQDRGPHGRSAILGNIPTW